MLGIRRQRAVATLDFARQLRRWTLLRAQGPSFLRRWMCLLFPSRPGLLGSLGSPGSPGFPGSPRALLGPLGLLLLLRLLGSLVPLAPLAPLASLAPLPLLAPLALGFPGSLGSLGPPSWAFLLACFLSGTSSQWIMLDWFRSSAGSGRNGPGAKQGTAHLLGTKASAEDYRQVCL